MQPFVSGNSSLKNNETGKSVNANKNFKPSRKLKRISRNVKTSRSVCGVRQNSRRLTVRLKSWLCGNERMRRD
jgi:hypothetical protein